MTGNGRTCLWRTSGREAVIRPPSSVRPAGTIHGTMTDTFKEPFPIRRKGDKWEVVAIIDGVFEGYIECDSEQQAQAVADSRVIYGLSMNKKPCDTDRVQRCLEALRRAGLNEHALIVRKLLGYAETLP